MFLMMADMAATTKTSTATCIWVVRSAGAIRARAVSTSPERATAALTMSALATMMTMSSEKPLNASLAGTMPRATPASSARRATTS